MESARLRAAIARRILVVDDDAVCRQFCSGVLARAGCRVRQAADARQAVEQLKAWRPAVVLFDLHLEGEPGTGLLPSLSSPQAVALHRCRWLMMTADEEQAESQPPGVDAVLLKPFAPDALLRAIGQLADDAGAGPARSRGHAGEAEGPPLAHRIVQPDRTPLLGRLATALPAELRALDRNIVRLQWPQACARLHRLAGATALAGLVPLSTACRLLQQCIARAAEPAALAQAYGELLVLARELLDRASEGTVSARLPG